MNLRKRKSTERQVDNFKHVNDDNEITAPSFLFEDENFLNETLLSNKKVKLEETKAVLDETVKIEDEGTGFNDYEKNNSDWEEVKEVANKRVGTKVSDKFMSKWRKQ